MNEPTKPTAEDMCVMDYDVRPKVVASRDKYRIVRARKKEAYDANVYCLELLSGEDAMGCQIWASSDSIPIGDLVLWIAVLSEDLENMKSETRKDG